MAVAADPARRGWLWKSAGSYMFNPWNERWFVLDDELLTYYENDKASEEKGSIPLAVIQAVQDSDNAKAKSKQVAAFDVVVGKRTFTFFGASKETSEEWRRDLEARWGKSTRRRMALDDSLRMEEDENARPTKKRSTSDSRVPSGAERVAYAELSANDDSKVPSTQRPHTERFVNPPLNGFFAVEPNRGRGSADDDDAPDLPPRAMDAGEDGGLAAPVPSERARSARASRPVTPSREVLSPPQTPTAAGSANKRSRPVTPTGPLPPPPPGDAPAEVTATTTPLSPEEEEAAKQQKIADKAAFREAQRVSRVPTARTLHQFMLAAEEEDLASAPTPPKGSVLTQQDD